MMNKQNNFYTNQLQAGLGLVDETKILLELWEENITASELHKVALQSGYFADKTSRRIKNIVSECFKPRYLVNDAIPAKNLKHLMDKINHSDLLQFFYFSQAERT